MLQFSGNLVKSAISLALVSVMAYYCFQIATKGNFDYSARKLGQYEEEFTHTDWNKLDMKSFSYGLFKFTARLGFTVLHSLEMVAKVIVYRVYNDLVFPYIVK